MNREKTLQILIFVAVFVSCVLIAVRQILGNGSKREYAKGFFGFGIGPSNQMLGGIYRSVERPSLKISIGSFDGWKSAKRPLELIVTNAEKNSGQNKIEIINDTSFSNQIASTLRLRPGNYLVMYSVSGNYPFGIAIVDRHNRETIASSVNATDDSTKFCWLQQQCFATDEERKLEVSKNFLFEVPPGATREYHLILDSLFWTYIYKGFLSIIALDTPTQFDFEKISWTPPLFSFEKTPVEIIVSFGENEIKTTPVEYKFVKIKKEPNSWVYREYLSNNNNAAPIITDDQIAIKGENFIGPIGSMPNKTYNHSAAFFMLDKQSPIFGFRINGHEDRFLLELNVVLLSKSYKMLVNLQSTKTGFELQLIYDFDNRLKARMLLFAGGPVIQRMLPLVDYPLQEIIKVEVSIDDVKQGGFLTGSNVFLNIRASTQTSTWVGESNLNSYDQLATNNVLADFIPIDRIIVGSGTDNGTPVTTCNLSRLRFYASSGYQWSFKPVDTEKRVIETVFSKSPVIAINNGVALMGAAKLTAFGNDSARPQLQKNGVLFEAEKNTHYQIPVVSFVYKRGFTFVCMLVPRFGADVSNQQTVFEFAEGLNLKYIRLLCDKEGFSLMFTGKWLNSNLDRRLSIGVNERRIVLGRIGESGASLELLSDRGVSLSSVSIELNGLPEFGVFNQNYIAKASFDSGKAGNFLLHHLYMYNSTLTAEEVSLLINYMKDVTDI